MAAGQAGAAALKAKHKRGAKESFRATDDVTRENVAAVPVASQQREQEREQQKHADKRQRNNQTNWTRWIIGLTGAAALAAAALRVLPKEAKKPTQTTDVPVQNPKPNMLLEPSRRSPWSDGARQSVTNNHDDPGNRR